MSVTLIVIAAIAGWAGIYAFSCWRWPLGYCWCCSGTGRHSRKDGKVFRECAGWRCWPGSCRGSGRRWRIGRRVWNFFRRHAHT